MANEKTQVAYYASEEYQALRAEAEALKARKELENAQESGLKEKERKNELKKLRKIYTAERCGNNNMLLVNNILERAAFLKAEIASIERRVQRDSVSEMFIQGATVYERESPMAKLHLRYVQQYMAVLKELNKLANPKGTSIGKKDKETSALEALMTKGAEARNKYRK